MTPLSRASRAGDAVVIDPCSTFAREMATCAAGVQKRRARIADAYSLGSRSTRCGRQASKAAFMAGRIAWVARRANSSRLASLDASAADATGRRSRIGATSSSGG